MELDLIRIIKKETEALSGRLLQGPLSKTVTKSIGDDCAELLPRPGASLLLTTDTMVEGVHFSLSYFTPFQLGRKLASVNLSDLAAMGGKPLAALLNVEVPAGLSDPSSRFWPDFSKGLAGRLAAFGAVVAGGDTVASGGGPLALTLTLVGEVERGRAVYRSGARPGDLIYCSGFLGESAMGLMILTGRRIRLPLPVKRALVSRHLDPEPRLALGRRLSECGATAMIDVSDGVATDLAHLCSESGVKAVLWASHLPESRASRAAAAALGLDSRSFCLRGGEDYELLWTIPPSRSRLAERAAAETGCRAFRIGVVQEGRGVWLQTGGTSCDVSFTGYEH